ncbi:MAG: rod-binding protein [Limisphaerales bacterium]
MSLTHVHPQLPATRPPSGDLTGEALAEYARNPRVSQSEKVAEASRQFEAVLVRQILSAARKTVIHSGLENESAAHGIYQDMINSQLADAITGAGGLGLARSLQVQVGRPARELEAESEAGKQTGTQKATDFTPTAPLGDLRSVTGFTHDGYQVRHD